MKKSFLNKISVKFTFHFLIIGLTPLIVFAALFYTKLQNSMQKTVGTYLEELVKHSGDNLQRTINQGLKNITYLSENPIISSENTTIPEKLIEMNKIQNLTHLYEDITLIDLNGIVITSTTYNYRGEWIGKEWYQKAKNGQTNISFVHIILSPKKYIFTFNTPVLNKEGEIVYVLSAQVNMQNFWDITDSIKIGDSGHLFLINKYGDIIAHPDKNLLFKKYHSYKNILSKDTGIVTDQENLISHAKIISEDNSLNWCAVISMPKDEAYFVVYQTQKQILFAFVLGFLVIILMTSFLAHNIVRPIRNLSLATQTVAKGNLDHTVEVDSTDEIGELAASFNQMTGQLRDAQVQLAKLASLGELVGGIAHEVNNPLASISARTQLLLRQKEEEGLSERAIKYLDTIDKQAERAGKIVRDLLQFSRQSKQEFQPTDINTAIEETLSFTEHQISIKNIKLTKELKPNLPEVMANKNQLQQVFFNMINNAADAMSDGGEITIKTNLNIPEENNSRTIAPYGRRNTDIKSPYFTEKHSEFVAIQISDTGTGISKENLAKILDPFFTTKEVGKGTGLGLSVSQGIVEQHGGKIEIESEVGKGTTFTIKLPVT